MEALKSGIVLNLVAYLLQLVPLYGPTYGEGDDAFHSGINRDYQISGTISFDDCIQDYRSPATLYRCVGFGLRFVFIRKPQVCYSLGLFDRVDAKTFVRSRSVVCLAVRHKSGPTHP